MSMCVGCGQGSQKILQVLNHFEGWALSPPALLPRWRCKSLYVKVDERLWHAWDWHLLGLGDELEPQPAKLRFSGHCHLFQNTLVVFAAWEMDYFKVKWKALLPSEVTDVTSCLLCPLSCKGTKVLLLIECTFVGDAHCSVHLVADLYSHTWTSSLCCGPGGVALGEKLRGSWG